MRVGAASGAGPGPPTIIMRVTIQAATAVAAVIARIQKARSSSFEPRAGRPGVEGGTGRRPAASQSRGARMCWVDRSPDRPYNTSATRTTKAISRRPGSPRKAQTAPRPIMTPRLRTRPHDGDPVPRVRLTFRP